MSGGAAAGRAGPEAPRGGPAPGARLLLTLAAAVVVFLGVWFARDILAPAAVAAVVVIVANPVRGPLVRRGWPSWLATTAVVVVSYLILAVLALLLIVATSQFIGMLPDYADELAASTASLVETLAGLGISAPTAATAVGWLDPETLIEVAGDVASAVLGAATAFFFVLAYAIFMAADVSKLQRGGSPFGSESAGRIARRYFTGVRRYYVVNASFGAVVAVLDGLALWALSIPGPVVWAILAFVTNFIPNIGFVIGLIPPLVLAFVVGGWPLALVVIAVYSVINVVLQVLVQPKFVADAVGLGLTITFFSVVFWTLVIGPIGAILSIPLTLLLRAVLLERDPGARVLRRLWGDPEADPSPLVEDAETPMAERAAEE